MASPNYDVRFRRPNPIVRSGMYVYVTLDFYGGYTESGVELGGYNSAGQRIQNPVFTDTDGVMYCNASAQWTGTYWKDYYFTHIYYFNNATVAAQCVSFKAWLYVNAIIVDVTPP